jgi:undecaprenyl pyrophosphate synthase
MIDPKLQARLRDLKIPNHLAVIPDGNRRWAAGKELLTMDGHRAGYETARELSRFCREIGIHTVTIWAFSTENWRRSQEEVSALMNLYEQWIEQLLPEAVEEQVRVIHLGRKTGIPVGFDEDSMPQGFAEGMPASLVQAIEDIEDKTRYFEGNVINLGINYGGADEVTRAVERMNGDLRSGGRTSKEIQIEQFLDTAGQPHPEPDIVWRTSGEFRSSGFLPLQSAYSEMIFTPKFFPDLGEADVVDAIEEYSARARRFGR